MAHTAGGLFSVIRETLATHAGLVDWLTLMTRKVLVALHWYDVPDNSNLYYSRLHSVVLNHMPVTSWTVLSFGLPGLLLALWQGRRTAPLLSLLLLQVALLATFPVTGRLRLLLIAAAIPFAGFFLATILSSLRRGAKSQLLLAMVMLIGSVCLSGRDLPPSIPSIRPVDFFVPMQIHYWPEDREALASGDTERVRELRLEAAELMRNYLRTPFDARNRRELEWRAQAHRVNAAGLEAVGDLNGAADAERQSAALRRELQLPR
jgi:hypothetical protein